MHAHHRRTLLHGPHGQRQRALGAVVNRGVARQLADERFAAGADEHRVTGGHQFVEPAKQ